MFFKRKTRVDFSGCDPACDDSTSSSLEMQTPLPAKAFSCFFGVIACSQFLQARPQQVLWYRCSAKVGRLQNRCAVAEENILISVGQGQAFTGITSCDAPPYSWLKETNSVIMHVN